MVLSHARTTLVLFVVKIKLVPVHVTECLILHKPLWLPPPLKDSSLTVLYIDVEKDTARYLYVDALIMQF